MSYIVSIQLDEHGWYRHIHNRKNVYLPPND